MSAAGGVGDGKEMKEARDKLFGALPLRAQLFGLGTPHGDNLLGFAGQLSTVGGMLGAKGRLGDGEAVSSEGIGSQGHGLELAFRMVREPDVSGETQGLLRPEQGMGPVGDMHQPAQRIQVIILPGIFLVRCFEEPDGLRDRMSLQGLPCVLQHVLLPAAALG